MRNGTREASPASDYEDFLSDNHDYADPDDFEDASCACACDCGCLAIIQDPWFIRDMCSMCEECCFEIPYEVKYSRWRREWWPFTGRTGDSWRRALNSFQRFISPSDANEVPF